MLHSKMRGTDRAASSIFKRANAGRWIELVRVAEGAANEQADQTIDDALTPCGAVGINADLRSAL